MTFKLAVIGHPIEHSLSPFIHQYFAKQHARKVDYQKINIDKLSAFRALIVQSATDYTGLNITVPYKQHLFACAENKPHAYRLEPIAKQAKAANTIAYQNTPSHQPQNGNLIGKQKHIIANTDGQGFINHLSQLGIGLADKKILIIGAGGASMGLLAQLTNDSNQAPLSPSTIYLFNRTEQKAAELCLIYGIHHWCNNATSPVDEIQFDVVVNATTQGIDDGIYHNRAFEQQHIHQHTFFYDLFYHQSRLTPFLDEIKTHYPHHRRTDGLGMLIEQAALSYQLWFNEFPNTDGLEQCIRIKQT